METINDLLNYNGLKIVQNTDWFKFSLDSVLLANFVNVNKKTKIIGGLGPCGRVLCCNSFLEEFESVSINMAKNQFLSLNPTKINGQCGRLLCCLNYEDDIYTELKKELPAIGNIVNIDGRSGKVVEVNILNNTYKVEFNDNTSIIMENDKNS